MTQGSYDNGELAPKVALENLDFRPPDRGFSTESSAARGQYQEPLKIRNTMRHKNTTDPKTFYPNYFVITVTRSEISQTILGCTPKGSYGNTAF